MNPPLCHGDDLEHRIASPRSMPNSIDNQTVDLASNSTPWRRALADLTANLSFSLAYGPLVDLYVSGRSWDEMLACRAIMVPVTIAASPIYGKFMDYCFSRWGITKKSQFLTTCKGDTATCAMFWAPLYMGVTMANGASVARGAIAFGYTALMAAPVGIAVNTWMRYLRNLFGVKEPQQ